jgi:predicted TIM-barrel fold metal-dependent hydrolase
MLPPADPLRWLLRQPAELRGRQLHLCQRFNLRRLPEQLWWLRHLLPVLQQREHLQRLVRAVVRRHLHQQFDLHRHRGRERNLFLWKQFHLSRHLHRGVLGELRRWIDLRPDVSIGYQPTLDSDGRPVHLSARPRKPLPGGAQWIGPCAPAAALRLASRQHPLSVVPMQTHCQPAQLLERRRYPLRFVCSKHQRASFPTVDVSSVAADASSRVGSDCIVAREVRSPRAGGTPADRLHGRPVRPQPEGADMEGNMRMLVAVIAVLVLSGCRAQRRSSSNRSPIIDMHLHAHSLSQYGGGMPNCANDQEIVYPGVDPREPITFARLKTCGAPLPAAATDEMLMSASLAALQHHNIFAVTTGPLSRVRAWRTAAPERIIPGHAFGDPGSPGAEEFRRLVNNRELALFAEVSPQYQGVPLDDPIFEPYFALAEELDIPVGVHLGEGPPGAPYWAAPSYRARLTSPLQLEEVLTRHPRLRLYVMHYASPLLDEMIAVLFSHPQVYVDIAGNNWAQPRPHFYGQLKRLVDAGFIKRIMWGSDQLIWPQAIEVAIETIEAAPFLSEEQKRDIFYHNAARFLRLTEDEVARHHEQ